MDFFSMHDCVLLGAGGIKILFPGKKYIGRKSRKRPIRAQEHLSFPIAARQRKRIPVDRT